MIEKFSLGDLRFLFIPVPVSVLKSSACRVFQVGNLRITVDHVGRMRY